LSLVNRCQWPEDLTLSSNTRCLNTNTLIQHKTKPPKPKIEPKQGLSVEEIPFAGEGAGGYQRSYRIRLQFYPIAKYPKEAEIQWEELVHCFNADFMPMLKKEVNNAIKKWVDVWGVWVGVWGLG